MPDQRFPCLVVVAIGIRVVAQALAFVAVVAIDVVVQTVVVFVAAAAGDEPALIVVAAAVVAVVVIVGADEMIGDAVAVDVLVGRRQRRHLRARGLRARVEAAPQPG